KAELARVRPLPCRYLNWCYNRFGLAVLWRRSKANDREFDPAAWLDETSGRRKQNGTSAVSPKNGSSTPTHRVTGSPSGSVSMTPRRIFACHVLLCQREGEGHGVILPCSISKVEQPAT